MNKFTEHLSTLLLLILSLNLYSQTPEVIFTNNVSQLYGSTNAIVPFCENRVYYVYDNEFLLYDGAEASLLLNSDLELNKIIGTGNGNLYFTATSESLGKELYVHNRDSIHLLNDLVNGSQSPIFSSASGIEFNNYFYFVLNDTQTGMELWRTDGLSLEQVSDIEPGPWGSSPSSFKTIGDYLYFTAQQNGIRELYRYDGSELNKVQTVNGYRSVPKPSLFSIQEHIGNIYFSATDKNFDTELWKYDGTDVSKVQDLNPNGSSNPRNITSFGTQLVFCAEVEEIGRELFVYDGTETVLLKDIRKGTDNSNARELTVVNDKLFFIASDTTLNDEIWQYDGDLVSICGDINPYGSGALGDLVKLGDILVFHGSNSSHGDEIWSYDGNQFSIHETNISGSGHVGNLSVVENTLYYDASTGDLGSQLWKIEFMDQLGAPTNYSCAPEPVVTSTEKFDDDYFSIYPNPSHGDDLHISLKEGGSGLIHIDLETTSGEVLLDETSNLEEVNTDLSSILSHATKGVYILHLDSDHHHLSEKVIIN